MTNTWQKRRKRNNWSGGYLEWLDGNTAYISVVFSWQLQKARSRALELIADGYEVYAGGPAVSYQPDFLNDIVQIGYNTPFLHRHNPNAAFTTRGCIRKCPFCIVPQIEGIFRELSDEEWEPKPVICDNNLLAASVEHFDHVIERLIESDVEDIDFNQGLDARLLTGHHARQFVRLHKLKRLKLVRLAWDNTKDESRFRGAYEALRREKMPKSKIQVYVLIGFNDTPEDALYRLETLWRELKILPNPMRYQPIDAKKRNEYVDPNWTEYELKRYAKYWSSLRYSSGIPFEEFDPRRHNK